MKARRFDFYADDWLAGTATLDAEEVGVYITAVAAIYSHGGPIPKTELRRLCRCHGNAYNRIVKKLLDLGKLIENGSDLTNKRCENELENARKRIEKATKSADKRWGTSKETNGLDSDLAHHTSNASRARLPSPSPSPSSSKKERERASAQASLSQDLIDEWIEEAREARNCAALPGVNLKAEWVKYIAGRDNPDRAGFVRWAMNARVNGAAESHNPRAAAGTVGETPWPQRCRGWSKGYRWHVDWGPEPGEPGCWVPADLVAEALRMRAEHHNQRAAE